MNERFGVTGGGARAGGFTLIELMVTLAVLTIIISLGVPLYGQFTQGSALTSRSSELVASLNYARSEAVTRRAPIRVAAIGGDWTDGWEVHDDAASPTLLRVVDLSGKDVGFDITELGGLTTITYDTQGRVPAAVQFTICPGGSGGNGRELTLSRFGRIEIDAGFSCP